MNEAYIQAKFAFESNEVPVGAVIARNGKIIATGKNNREESHDATGHAEALAIRQACESLGTWRLDDCTLYVTLEPCPMCMGAIINSRIKRVVFGAKDPKAGACGSVINLNNYPFNHKPEILSGVMTEECQDILSDFFVDKRDINK